MSAVSLLSFHVVLTIFAVVLAVHCNKDNKFLMGVVALLFPQVYLVQYGVRRYFLKESNYCGLNLT